MTPIPPWSADPRRIGLVIAGVLHLAMSATVTWEAYTPGRALLHQLLPDGVRIILWIVGGLLSLAGAAGVRWQTVGYGVAVLMPAERAVSHLWSWLAHIWPGPPPGDPAGLAWAVAWASTAALIVTLGGIPAAVEVERDGA